MFHNLEEIRMNLSIRPGKVTCAGLVGIMLVLPNNFWKSSSADAKVRVLNEREAKPPKKIR
jgi:hypothetical protein